MNEDGFNMSVRKFLKEVGVTSQREIERVVREAVDAGRLKDTDKLEARMTLEIGELGLRHVVEGDIEVG
jgi:predicted Co/Zn/Cd cation transporter (cation efflux family)